MAEFPQRCPEAPISPSAVVLGAFETCVETAPARKNKNLSVDGKKIPEKMVAHSCKESRGLLVGWAGMVLSVKTQAPLRLGTRRCPGSGHEREVLGLL